MTAPAMRITGPLPTLTLGTLLLGPAACTEEAQTAEKTPAGNAAVGLRNLTQGSAAAARTPASATAPGTPTGTQNSNGSPDDGGDIAYAYSPIGKRDPFRSLFDQLQREDNGAQTTELQKFELDQLKLVAIISRIATPYAMVEDPEGKGHTLTRGTIIGKNWGRVSQITPDCVVIKEEYRDYTGRKVTNKTEMCLPKPNELKLD